MKRKAQTLNTGILVSLVSVVVLLVIITIIMAFSGDINDDIQDDFGEDNCAARSDTYTLYNATAKQCYNSSGTHVVVGTVPFNSTEESLQALDTLSEKQNTWALIIGVGVVITLLLGFLGFVAFRAR